LNLTCNSLLTICKWQVIEILLNNYGQGNVEKL
jgi:hypothetical protein